MGLMDLIQRVDYLKNICRDKSVLHLGCTDWPYTQNRLEYGNLLHLELQEYAASIWGIDGDQQGLDILTRMGISNLFRGNLESLHQVDCDRTFDVILAGEVIEHLSNPGLFLRGVQRFMRPDSVLVITTVNAYCGFRMFRYLTRGHGGAGEPVHPDHVAYYSYATLTHLLTRENLAVRKFFFYDLGTEHRPHNLWYLNVMNDICVRIAKHLADGVIAECQLAG
jgi:SAM-dependent methyltransferase